MQTAEMNKLAGDIETSEHEIANRNPRDARLPYLREASAAARAGDARRATGLVRKAMVHGVVPIDLDTSPAPAQVGPSEEAMREVLRDAPALAERYVRAWRNLAAALGDKDKTNPEHSAEATKEVIAAMQACRDFLSGRNDSSSKAVADSLAKLVEQVRGAMIQRSLNGARYGDAAFAKLNAPR